jgi:hypothetical protein
MGSIVLMCSLAASAGAQECEAPEQPASTRPAPDHAAEAHGGWIIGGGITGGNTAFTGAEGLAVAVGPVVEVQVPLLGGPVMEERRLDLINATTLPPAGTVHVAPIPRKQAGGALTVHGGYAFSPRLALLADVEVMMSDTADGFMNGVFATVLRFRPVRRMWIEAGPALGDLGYSYQDTVSKSDSISGTGFHAAGGISVLARERWTLDMQARYAKIWYQGFQARNLSVGLSVGTIRSGKAPKPGSPAAARRDGASRG